MIYYHIDLHHRNDDPFFTRTNTIRDLCMSGEAMLMIEGEQYGSEFTTYRNGVKIQSSAFIHGLETTKSLDAKFLNASFINTLWTSLFGKNIDIQLRNIKNAPEIFIKYMMAACTGATITTRAIEHTEILRNNFQSLQNACYNCHDCLEASKSIFTLLNNTIPGDMNVSEMYMDVVGEIASEYEVEAMINDVLFKSREHDIAQNIMNLQESHKDYDIHVIIGLAHAMPDALSIAEQNLSRDEFDRFMKHQQRLSFNRLIKILPGKICI